MSNGKLELKNLLNHFEIYATTVCFFVLTILLTLQVISRYVLNQSFTWMEELGTIMFIWMIYLGISGAVTSRKHLRIDFVLEMVPFKIKRILLMFSNLVFAVFNVYISFVMLNVMKLLGTSVTTMLRIQKVVVYAIIPFSLILASVRLVQDTIRLSKENATELGASKPSLDLASCEREFRNSLLPDKKRGS